MARRTRNNVTYEENLEAIKMKIEEKPKIALREIAKLMVKEMKKLAAKSKSKRFYSKNGQKVLVKPGRLKKSIKYKYVKNEKKMYIGSNKWYAFMEEKGTSKNIARPFIMPVYDKMKDEIISILERTLRQ